MKIYISFGQDHAHSVAGHTLDKNSIAVIQCKDHIDGRAIDFELFGDKFGTSYTEEEINKAMHHFPRGQILAN